MMRIDKVWLTDIRNFANVEFDFKHSKIINTISGVNGSGKTTLVKCILLCQKAFFAVLIDRLEIVSQLRIELSKYFNSKDSSIKIQFEISDLDCMIAYPELILSATRYTTGKVEWVMSISEEHRAQLIRYWNLENPSNIIVYVDSNKSFVENDTLQSQISVVNLDKRDLIIDTVLHPEKIFSNIYNRLFNDYISQRLVPSTPKKDLYYTVSRILLKDLLPHLELANFTGTHLTDRFVLLGKSANLTRSKRYDIRNFSSGEKTIFYLLLFLNYVKGIGLLIIDEPENHFHEELLTKLIRLLSNLAEENVNYGDFILEKAKNLGMSVSDKGEKGTKTSIQNEFKHGLLKQVFLLTHSKNLIYNNFTSGANFYICDGLTELKYENAEAELRKIGLSTIYSKVLFVEGDGDTSFLNRFLSELNIKIHPLQGCGEVIATYKRIKNVKEYVRDCHFCFLIDRDTRSDHDIDKIADGDAEFNNHFIVLERHELENYFLDPKLFHKLYEKLREQDEHLPEKGEKDLQQMMKKEADFSKHILFTKALKIANERAISTFNKQLLTGEIPVTAMEDYSKYFESRISGLKLSEGLLALYNENFQKCEKAIANWDEQWQTICDGKITWNRFLAMIEKETGNKKDVLFRKFIKTVEEDYESELSNLLKSIKTKFQSKS